MRASKRSVLFPDTCVSLSHYLRCHRLERQRNATYLFAVFLVWSWSAFGSPEYHPIRAGMACGLLQGTAGSFAVWLGLGTSTWRRRCVALALTLLFVAGFEPAYQLVWYARGLTLSTEFNPASAWMLGVVPMVAVGSLLPLVRCRYSMRSLLLTTGILAILFTTLRLLNLPTEGSSQYQIAYWITTAATAWVAVRLVTNPRAYSSFVFFIAVLGGIVVFALFFDHTEFTTPARLTAFFIQLTVMGASCQIIQPTWKSGDLRCRIVKMATKSQTSGF